MDRPSAGFHKGPYDKNEAFLETHKGTKQHLVPCGTPHLSSTKGSNKSQYLALTSLTHHPHHHVTSVPLVALVHAHSTKLTSEHCDHGSKPTADIRRAHILAKVFIDAD